MPKKPYGDKKSPARNGRVETAFRQAPASVNDLLQGRPLLTGLASRIPEQRAWTAWLRQQLPEALATHLVNVVPKPLDAAGRALELVVLADSPAWSARLRYALAALEGEIRAHDAAVHSLRVRVAPSDQGGL